MAQEPDQVTAWKDVDARDGDTDDHPAGKMRLPGRLSVSRAAILAGYVTAAVAPGLVVTNNLPTIPSSLFC